MATMNPERTFTLHNNRKYLKSKIKLLLENTFCRIELFRQITGIGYFGLNKLDREIRKLTPWKNGFFVELGANDGLSQSNTLSFEKYLGYSGILIEPYFKNYEKCVKNRSQKNHFFNCACVSFEYPDSRMELLYANLMTTPLGGEVDISDREAHAHKGERYLEGENIHKFTANATTLSEILDLSRAPRIIELLSLDVEGGEIEVLKGINHQKYRFKVICVETRDLDSLTVYLEGAGYNFRKKISHHDYIFVDSGIKQ